MFYAIDVRNGRIVARARAPWVARDLASRKGIEDEAVAVVDEAGNVVEGE